MMRWLLVGLGLLIGGGCSRGWAEAGWGDAGSGEAGRGWPGCANREEPAPPAAAGDGGLVSSRQDGGAHDATAATEAGTTGGAIEPDGNDDPEDPGVGQCPFRGELRKVGRAALALRRICDLTPHGSALYGAHAYQPLGSDGAVISRYVPDEPRRPFQVAFDWNRPGEPKAGGGSGQGFVRVRRLDGRLFVADADPPHAGFGLVDRGTEGYVFVSDHQGRFAPTRPPKHRPPGLPDAADRAGAGVVPRAYHVIDVIRYQGRYLTSTGSVPPGERAWRGPAPGALHVASPDLQRWSFEVDYPYPWQNGVWRLTYLVRFRGRLYAGIQDYDGRDPHDFVYFEPGVPGAPLTRAQLHPVRITAAGAAQTLRWYADQGRLYWIGWGREGVGLWVTSDGDRWAAMPLPSEAGPPSDLIRFRDALLVLTERQLLRLEETGVTPIAIVREKKSPFVVDDLFCTAPLAVFRNTLYAGGQRDGALYRLLEGPQAD